MEISKTAFKNNRVTLISILAMCCIGLYSYNNMPKAQDPGFKIRNAQIITRLPGASPSRVENLVTDKLEEELQSIPEIKEIQSRSQTGLSIITVELVFGVENMDQVWQDIRNKVSKVYPQLPSGASQPFVDSDIGDVFGIVMAVTGDGFNYRSMKLAANQIKEELLTLGDVAKVDFYGYQEERLFIDFNNAKLSEWRLSPTQLLQLISSQNIIDPGGTIELIKESITVEPTGNFTSIADVKNLLLPLETGVVRLGDVANVYMGYIDPPSTLMRTNGHKSIGIAINMRDGGNIVKLGKKVKKKVASLRSKFPIGLEIHELFYESELVNKTISDFTVNLVQSILIVSAVMFLFLGIKTGLVVSSLIPTTILITVAIMSIFSIGMDQVSLAALMIALGMLVDNAIVMCESTVVSMELGKTPYEAAMESAAELKIPLLTSSLTTIAAFMPFALAESNMGEYVAPLPKVVGITLLTSWVVTMTFIPILCVALLKAKPKTNEKGNPYFEKFFAKYKRFLISVLTHKLIASLTFIVIIISSVFLFSYVRKGFFPPQYQPLFTMEIELPQGTPVKYSSKVMANIDKFIRSSLQASQEKRGIVQWSSYVGSSGPRYVLSHAPKPGETGYVFTLFRTTDPDIVDKMIKELETYTWNTFPDSVTTIKKLANGAAVDYPIEFKIRGSNLEKLYKIVSQTSKKLATVEGVKNISDNWGAKGKKIIIDIDQERAQRGKITNNDAAISLQSNYTGIEVSQFRRISPFAGDSGIIPVVLRAPRDSIDYTNPYSISIYNSSGQSLPLKQIANESIIWEPLKILRFDRKKEIIVHAGLIDGFNYDQINKIMKPWLDEQKEQWPPGYDWEVGGEEDSNMESNASVVAKLPLGLLIILILLIVQFNSVRKTTIILSTIPLSLFGVASGLLLTSSYFGFFTLLGIISLAGIVINNAIVLLDRINIEIVNNQESEDRAILLSSTQRFRPILLTTATTIAGLIPLLVSGGEMWRPMAITLIFGLIGCTVMTLAAIPLLYAILFRVDFKSKEYNLDEF